MNRWKCRHVGRARLIHLGGWCCAVLTKRKSEILPHIALEIEAQTERPDSMVLLQLLKDT